MKLHLVPWVLYPSHWHNQNEIVQRIKIESTAVCGAFLSDVFSIHFLYVLYYTTYFIFVVEFVLYLHYNSSMEGV